MGKSTICIGKNKDADQLCSSNCTLLISIFVFAIRIVQFLFFLNPKFPTSSYLLCLYSLVCFGPGRKSKLLVFSCTGSIGDLTNFRSSLTGMINIFSGGNCAVYSSIQLSNSGTQSGLNSVFAKI